MDLNHRPWQNINFDELDSPEGPASYIDLNAKKYKKTVNYIVILDINDQKVIKKTKK